MFNISLDFEKHYVEIVKHSLSSAFDTCFWVLCIFAFTGPFVIFIISICCLSTIYHVMVPAKEEEKTYGLLMDMEPIAFVNKL